MLRAASLRCAGRNARQRTWDERPVVLVLEFDRTIAPEDHMFISSNPEPYFRTSLSGLECIMAGLASAGREPDTVGSVLDFGSGYGRVYRAIAAAFPQAGLTACDLMAPAAKFCAETFGGDWVASEEDLNQVTLPRKYDLVWLGSVFTHLPAHKWWALLKFLSLHANPDAVIVFTTHGQSAIDHIAQVVIPRNPNLVDGVRFAQMRESLNSVGFDFIASKPAVINHQHRMGMEVSNGEYGFSFSTPWWIAKFFESHPEFRLVDYRAPGWAGNHDAVILTRRAL